MSLKKKTQKFKSFFSSFLLYKNVTSYQILEIWHIQIEIISYFISKIGIEVELPCKTIWSRNKASAHV